MLRKLSISVGLALVAAALALALERVPFVREIELQTYDWRMQLTARPAGPVDDIVLVSINDDSVRRMAPLVGRWPWPRMVHASLIDFLSRAPAKVIVYDVLFTEPDIRSISIDGEEWTGQESDQALVDAVAKAGNVILGADVDAEALSDRSKELPVELPANLNATYGGVATCVIDRPVVVPPFPALMRAARGIGHTWMKRDDDGPLRRHWPFARVQQQVIPSLSVAGTWTVADIRGALAAQTATCNPYTPYRGPTIGNLGQYTFQDFSFYNLFYSEQQILAGETPEIDPASFKDRVVVVSATASGTYEVQATPFGQGITGGEVHANLIDSFLRGRSITPLASGRAAALTVASALVVGLLGTMASVWLLAGAALVLAAVIVWAGVSFFAAGVWLPLVGPLTAIGLAFVGQLSWQYFVEGREKRQVKRLFARYVPKDVYEQLMVDPTRAALGGKRRSMTVLFSDVRGFTAMSEKASPEDVVNQLNEYFSRMVQVLFDHRGTLDKFVGDMVMGLFGAPLDDEEHAEHAVQAALAMSRELDALNAEWQQQGRPTLDIGIGISTGEMVAGNIGSETIMSYTVIGDTVNLGARLESLNKDYGTRIIISEATHAALKGRYDVHPLGEVVVKGKSRPVAIYEVKSS